MSRAQPVHVFPFEGPITPEVLEALVEELSRDPERTHSGHALYDLRGATVSGLAEDDLREFVARIAALSPTKERRVAIVVGSDVDFGIARMYQTLASLRFEQSRRVFRDYDEAMTWLRAPSSE